MTVNKGEGQQHHRSAKKLKPSPLNPLLSDNMLITTQCCVARLYILNEGKVFQTFPWQNRDKTPKKF